MSAWLLATGDFTTLGGMDRANHALASFLARQNHDVHLVAHCVEPLLAGATGVHPHLVPRPFGSHLAGAPLLARAAARQARELGPSARALMNGGNGAIGAPTWVHYLHAAYVPEVNASRTKWSRSLGRRYYLGRERKALLAAPIVICNSERTAEDVRRFYTIPASRVRVVYYGSDARTFAPATDEQRRAARSALGVADGRLVGVFVGALGDRRKGFDVVFAAWQALAADPEWDVDLLAAGSGAEAPAWSARARTAGIDRHVKLLGFRADINHILAAADVLVHPARYEAYGLAVHEAICRGVPAIVTSVAGVTERFPGELDSLILTDPPRPEALVATLRAWRSHAAEWRARAAAVGELLRARSWDDMASEIAPLIGGAA